MHTHGAMLGAFITLWCVTSCSTSEFGGNSGGIVPGKQTEKKQDSNDDIENSTDSNQAGAERFERRTDSAVTSHDADLEVAEGCRLPENVKAVIAGAKSSTSIFGLLGWGGGGSAVKLDLTNLDIRDCSWFARIKDDPSVKFAFVYHKRDANQAAIVQSYIEPVEGANDQRSCSGKATNASRSLGKSGTIQCASLPRDKEGMVIEN